MPIPPTSAPSRSVVLNLWNCIYLQTHLNTVWQVKKLRNKVLADIKLIFRDPKIRVRTACWKPLFSIPYPKPCSVASLYSRSIILRKSVISQCAFYHLNYLRCISLCSGVTEPVLKIWSTIKRVIIELCCTKKLPKLYQIKQFRMLFIITSHTSKETSGNLELHL